jgi:hypothetical protein
VLGLGLSEVVEIGVSPGGIDIIPVSVTTEVMVTGSVTEKELVMTGGVRLV